MLLQNGTTATLNFSSAFSSRSIDIVALCDGIVEGEMQSCTLEFGTVTIPEHITNLIVDRGRQVNVGITECENDCEFCASPL